MKNEYLVCGQIMRSHGITGAMIINQYCDSYEVFCELSRIYLKSDDSFIEYKVEKCAPYKTSVLLTIDGIETPEEVTKLRGSYLYAKREDILKDENDFFIVDLIDLPVVDANTSVTYGTLKEVINQGAQDIYVVKRDGKGDAYIPCVNEFVKEIKLDEAIYITPIEGMLD